MSVEGPPLEILLRRLTETPSEFLEEPRIGRKGQVVVAALLNDCSVYFGSPISDENLSKLITDEPRHRPRLQLTMILTWLVRLPVFRQFNILPEQVQSALINVPETLIAPNVTIYVEDPERREELARTLLTHLDLHPEGETEKQSADRLMAISASERKRLLHASRTAEKRAREVREALAKKAAQESADKWTRE